MRRLASLMLFTLLTSAFPVGPVQGQEWRPAPERDVLLTNGEISPRELHLKAGQAVRLRFVNDTNQTMSFAAQDFFRAAQIRAQDADSIRRGTIEVAPLSDRTVMLIPKAGRYSARSHNFIRRLLGMSSRIIVE